MQIALIADIHGNLAAFDAVLAEIERVQPNQIVCLGDVIAEGPWPHEVLERLRQLACPLVLGNADAKLPVLPDEADVNDENARKIHDISRWGSAQLDDTDRTFIASFQPTVEPRCWVVERTFAFAVTHGAAVQAATPS